MIRLTIRTFAPHEWQTYKTIRLQALADAPDAFGSTFEREQQRSDAEWEARLAEGAEVRWNLPLFAEVDQAPAGLAWGRIETATPDVAHLYQMWVAPGFRRLGIGQKLVEAVIDWARGQGAGCLNLHVTIGNDAAIRLYRRAGFEPVEEPELLRPGSDLLEQPMRLTL